MRVDGPSAAALAAREEPPVNCPEDEWHTRAEHEHGLHNETPVAACPLCDPLITGIAAREDTERPGEGTCECDSCGRRFPLGVFEFGRGGKATCPECTEGER